MHNFPFFCHGYEFYLKLCSMIRRGVLILSYWFGFTGGKLLWEELPDTYLEIFTAHTIVSMLYYFPRIN